MKPLSTLDRLLGCVYGLAAGYTVHASSSRNKSPTQQLQHDVRFVKTLLEIGSEALTLAGVPMYQALIPQAQPVLDGPWREPLAAILAGVIFPLPEVTSALRVLAASDRQPLNRFGAVRTSSKSEKHDDSKSEAALEVLALLSANLQCGYAMADALEAAAEMVEKSSGRALPAPISLVRSLHTKSNANLQALADLKVKGDPASTLALSLLCVLQSNGRWRQAVSLAAAHAPHLEVGGSLAGGLLGAELGLPGLPIEVIEHYPEGTKLYEFVLSIHDVKKS